MRDDINDVKYAYTYIDVLKHSQQYIARMTVTVL